jgi:transposase
MVRQAKPTIIELDMTELEDVLRRAESKLDEKDYTLLKALAESYSYLTQVVGDKNTSIVRLRKLLFGAKTEKTSKIVGHKPSSAVAEVPASDTTALAPTPESTVAPTVSAGGEAATAASGDTKTDAQAAKPSQAAKKASPGHGRNGADAYTAAEKVEVPHPSLQPGDPCPKCEKGTVYETNRPRVLVRLKAQAPVQATVFSLQKLRCNLCDELFIAESPAGVGEEKYDATVGSMIGLLRYGMGMPMNRNELLQESLGVPLPDATQWEIVADQAERIELAFDELARQAAQSHVIYNDDTTVRILAMMPRDIPADNSAGGAAAHDRESTVPGRVPAPSADGQTLSAEEAPAERAAEEDAAAEKCEDERTGLFTTGIVAELQGGQKIALFLSGHQHAGENLKDVLARRVTGLPPPIQMCDALSRNIPKGLKTILGNCLAHGRRKFVDVADRFPEECRHVLEALSVVYHNDEIAKERALSSAERLLFHQAESGPVMEELHAWLGRQIEERRVEPNSALGASIAYMRRHWQELTLFLRVAGAPLDNNICERALKLAIRHRKNSLFYKTSRGAHVGDIYMSLIHTCRLGKVNPFDYLTELDRHAEAMASNPAAWMPWNYRQNLAAATAATSAAP